MPLVARARALLLAVVMAALLLPGAAGAVLGDSVGTCGFAGSGTAEDPFQVATGADLTCLKDNAAYWGSTFLQTADVYHSGPAWTHGIGTTDDWFYGTYDGGNHVVNGLTIEATTAVQGLFGRVKNGTVKQVTVNGTLSITSDGLAQDIGGVVGLAENATLDHLDSSVAIFSTGLTVQGVGGVVGTMWYGTGTLSYATGHGEITLHVTDGVASEVGLVVGRALAGSIADASASGQISITINRTGTESPVGARSTGGLAGSIQDTLVDRPYADTTITSTVTSLEPVSSYQQEIGGLVGSSMRVTYTDAVALGSITLTTTGDVGQVGGLYGLATDSHTTRGMAAVSMNLTSTAGEVLSIGGLAGATAGGSLTQVSATSAMVLDGATAAMTLGGLLGYVDPGAASEGTHITDAYAAGAINAPGGSWMAGLAGYTYGGSIENAYTATTLSGGADHLAGFVAEVNAGTPTTFNGTNFYSTETTGQSTARTLGDSANVVGLPTAAMTAFATYASGGTQGDVTWTSAWPIANGWEQPGSSSNTWGICAAVNTGLPFLLWEQQRNNCERTLTVTPPNGGTISDGGSLSCTGSSLDTGTCEVVYPAGTLVNLTAMPDAGYGFSSWTGDCAGTVGASCQVDLGANQAVGAIFDSGAPQWTTPLKVTLRTGATLATGATPAIPVTLTWQATGPVFPVTGYQLQRKLGTGAWTTIALPSALSTSIKLTVPATGTFAFRVKAVTSDPSAWSLLEMPASTARLLQQTVATVKYAGTWTSASSTAFSGGSVKWSKAAKASATFTFTGTAVALLSEKATLRGKVTITVDGGSPVTVDLRGATLNRVLAWQWSGRYGKHTVKVVVAGTAGRPRVDLDGFVTMSLQAPPPPISAPER